MSEEHKDEQNSVNSQETKKDAELYLVPILIY
jgi:hypothetical protein